MNPVPGEVRWSWFVLLSMSAGSLNNEIINQKLYRIMNDRGYSILISRIQTTYRFRMDRLSDTGQSDWQRKANKLKKWETKETTQIFRFKYKKGNSWAWNLLCLLSTLQKRWKSQINRLNSSRSTININIYWSFRKIAEPTEAGTICTPYDGNTQVENAKDPFAAHTLSARYVRTQPSNPFREIQLTWSGPWHSQPCELFYTIVPFSVVLTFIFRILLCIAFPFIHLFCPSMHMAGEEIARRLEFWLSQRHW